MNPVANFSIIIALLGLVACNSNSGSPTTTTDSTLHPQLSNQLEKVMSQHSPEVTNVKSPVIQGLFDDIVSVLKVVVADAAGALGGSVAGSAAGGPAGSIVGAVVGAVTVSTIVAATEGLVTPGSPNPFNPAYSPYAGSKPVSLDSIGWLHNDCIQSAVINAGSVGGSAIANYTNARLINTFGYPTSPTTSVDWNAVDSICLAISGESTIPDMLSHISGLGLGAEADYIQDLVDDIEYLYNNNYPYQAAVSLVETYKSDVDSLSISFDRRADLKRTLSVFSYSMSLWSQNP